MRSYKKIFTVIILSILIQNCPTGGQAQQKITTLYFVRHAETVANATNIYTEETMNKFSETGIKQIERLKLLLEELEFDAIIVSPIWRARFTIYSFLKSRGQTAELWPELAECCWQIDKQSKENVALKMGAIIDPEDEIVFKLRDSLSTRFYDVSGSFAEGIAQVDRGVKLFKEKFSGSGKTILMVAHYYSGNHFLHKLLDKNDEKSLELKNAALTKLIQIDNENFKISYLNK